MSPAYAAQATHPQSTAGDARRGKALQQLGAFLRGLAAEENPGVPIKMLPTEPFKDPQGQVRLGCASMGGRFRIKR